MSDESLKPDWRPGRALQEKLGYQFKEPLLLGQALTHTSWSNEHGLGSFHNERLEFLGDAVLELCVTRELFHRFPDAREGALTSARSDLVNEPELARLARHLGIENCLRLGKGEDRQGGRSRDAVLADALEAILGAIYEDGGFDAAVAAVSMLYSGAWPAAIEKTKAKDAKSRILEYCQSEFRETPVYAVTSASGPSHDRIFEVEITLPDGRKFSASASSTKKAEQGAAAAAIAVIGAEGGCAPDPALARKALQA